jgi:hypothetical protein
MDNNLLTTLVTTSGAVIIAVSGFYFNSIHLNKRLERIEKGIDDTRLDLKELAKEFHDFKEIVNSKFAAIDLEIARLMDRFKDK